MVKGSVPQTNKKYLKSVDFLQISFICLIAWLAEQANYLIFESLSLEDDSIYRL